MRHLTRLMFFVLVTISPSCFSQNTDKSWKGDYEYSNSFWDGTQSIITDINLRISPDGSCSISWEGFQKDEQIICSTDTDSLKNSVTINFISYSNGASKNEYGVEVYKPKMRLLSLTKLDKKPIITTWSESFRPPKTKKVGIYFKKID